LEDLPATSASLDWVLVSPGDLMEKGGHQEAEVNVGTE
jgi:hypothetical protein